MSYSVVFAPEASNRPAKPAVWLQDSADGE